MIEFEFGALAGAFGDAFEQVASHGRQPNIFVQELRVASLSNIESGTRERTIRS